MIATRERCAACHKVSPVSFAVPNEVWWAVVHPQFQDSVLCLLCFVSRADEKLIAWDRQIELFPVSMATLLRRERGITLPAEDLRPHGASD